MIRSIFILTVFSLAACAPQPVEQSATTKPMGPAMVAAANSHAVEAGLEILRNGGNAIDASVAVQSVLGLVEPQSSGLGGGAFLVYYDAATGKVTSFDGREAAPSGVSAELFLDEAGHALGYLDAVNSGHAVGVPGAMAMLGMAHAAHGNLPWGSLFDGATQLAKDGFAVSPRLAALLSRFGKRVQLDQDPNAAAYFFQADGTPLSEGFVRDNPAYANTLRQLAKNPRALLEGELAEQIVNSVANGPRPGALSLADLAAYQPSVHDAVCRPYRARQICSAPPPSSGGHAINAILGILSNFEFSDQGADDPGNWHLLIEAQRLAYADRDRYIADDAMVAVPLAGLLDAEYLRQRAALIRPGTAIVNVTAGNPKGAIFGRDSTKEEKGTSHFSIVDGWGNAVAMTTTVESIFGNKRMVGGFLLNNQLTDFARNPVDADGLPLANAPAPGKRPRSSMSPTIVLDVQGQFMFATGSPGGNSIIAYTAKSLVGVLDWGLTPQAAIDLPNVIARGDITQVGARNLDPNLIPALEQMGHVIRSTRGEGSGLYAIQRLSDGTLVGGADPRREGVARELQ